MRINRWSLLAQFEEEYGDENETDRSGPGYSEDEVDAVWQAAERKFRDDLDYQPPQSRHRQAG